MNSTRVQFQHAQGLLALFEKHWRSLQLALRSLWLHKLRSFLSVLGIIIATIALIVLMAFGEGSMQDALEAIKRQGATNIIVRSSKPPDDSSNQRRTMVLRYGLTQKDYAQFLTINDVVRHVPMRIFDMEIRLRERVHNGRVVATLPDYSVVNQIDHLAAGRFLTDDDDHFMDNVAVLGSAAAEKLFPFDDPIGKAVGIGKFEYKVVGVLKSRIPLGDSGSRLAEDFNKDVYIPLQTCRARFGQRIFQLKSGSHSAEEFELSQVTLTLSDTSKVRPAGDVVRRYLEGSHLKKDWEVTIPLDKLLEAEQTRDRYLILLAVIAFISLLVGGIGIMNIMLATVTERTREIGIRRALGAKRRDIIMQFLIEAVAQTIVGGLAGILLGLAAVWLVPPVWKLIADKNLPATVNVLSIYLSLIVSVGVGVIFGLYPAWRASHLDPIEALRHE